MILWRERLRWWLFPGLNLHARLRFRVLPLFFASPKSQDSVFLDAGCGNGMLSYAAWRLGYRVVAVSLKQDEITKCRSLFNDLLGISEQRLEFRLHDLYAIQGLGMLFDEIVCSEVLEHIERDGEVCRSFWNILKVGGALHLCVPFADHPDHRAEILDRCESGGHVRPGYTESTLRALLEPIGFRITTTFGLGGPMRQWVNKRMITLQQRGAVASSALLAIVTWPFWGVERAGGFRVPYSLYVRAEKPQCGKGSETSSR